MNVSLRTRAAATAAAAVFATGLCAAVASAAPSVAAGVTIHAVLTSSDIYTKNAYAGKPFTMRVVGPYGEDRSLAGATIRGHVSGVRSAGQGRTAQLGLAFDSITIHGSRIGLHARLTALGGKYDNTVARKAVGAGVGMAVGSQTVGRLLGGTLGAVVGDAGGAAAGYAYANNNKPNYHYATGQAATLVTTAAS